MIIYTDIFNGAELISDSYDLKEVDGIVYEADAKMITIGAVNVDTGANASAEEADEGTDDNEEKKLDIEYSFRLINLGKYNKKDYLGHLGKYMKNVAAHMAEKGKSEDEITEFKAKAQAYAKKILPNIKEYDFYMSDNEDNDVASGKCMLVFVNYREDGMTPYFTFWKDGMNAMKV
ncbi:hypothetical protein PG984_002592 [Apiospora sp. TS-2023a]|jgi:uncharacterized protein with ATP-grasp and redox domains